MTVVDYCCGGCRSPLLLLFFGFGFNHMCPTFGGGVVYILINVLKLLKIIYRPSISHIFVIFYLLFKICIRFLSSG